jgi:hypothetical protein
MWHGVDLAGTVYDMKWWQNHVKQRPDRVNELNTLGFVWERLQPEWNLILEALAVYRGLHGNLLVPSDFAVPHNDDRWPKACWGIKLGSAVYKIRGRGDHLRDVHTSWSRREQLDSMGFVWDVQQMRFAKFCTALKLYGQIEQKIDPQRQLPLSSSGVTKSVPLNIPSKFVVPRSSQWPNKLWGYRLGERCTQVRQKQLYVKGHPDRLKILADLGLYISGGNDDLRWLEVVHAAAVYSQMNGNTLDVPTNFAVPAPPRRITGRKSDDPFSDIDESCIVGSDDAWPWPGKCPIISFF